MNAARAIAILRIVTGVLVASHGIRKIIKGPATAIGGTIAKLGLPAPEVLAWLATLGELSGILLALGAFTRLAGAAVAATMGGIVVFIQARHLTGLGTGAAVVAEYPLLLAVLGLFFVAVGPGTWALRNRF